MSEKKNYYERLAENPRVALEAVAQRRNLTLEELEARVANIHTVAARGEHLTLGQASSFRDAPDLVAAAIKQGDDAWVWMSDDKSQPDSAAVAASLGALEQATSAALEKAETSKRESESASVSHKDLKSTK